MLKRDKRDVGQNKSCWTGGELVIVDNVDTENWRLNLRGDSESDFFSTSFLGNAFCDFGWFFNNLYLVI